MLENSPENVAAEQKYGIGSPFWTAGTAISGALAGLTGGDMSQALAGGLAPYLSLAVKAATTDAKGNVNQAENITGHALAGAVVAYLQGGSVTGGAAGAATGELAAQLIAKELYPGVKPENLTNEQKANVSALSTLAAGLAGGVAGNSSVAAGTGGIAGKTAVENNYLSANQALTFDKEMQSCKASGGDCTAVIDKWKKVSDEQSNNLDDTLANNPAGAVAWDKEVAEGGTEMAKRPGWLSSAGVDVMTNEEAKAYVQQWNGQDLAKIDANTPGWIQFSAFVSDPENQAMLASGGLLVKDLTKVAISFMSRNTATATVKASEIGMQWGEGNIKQGMPWEDYVGTTLSGTADRLPVGFKTFDYYDASSKAAYSVKSLDTQTMSRLNRPNQLYSSVKKNIDDAAGFKEASRSGVELNNSMISTREIKLAIPDKTSSDQWTQINRAIVYGESLGIKVTVTQVK